MTLESGNPVPPYPPRHLENFVRQAKASFGDEVYTIAKETADDSEMERKLVDAFERTRTKIKQKTTLVETGLQMARQGGGGRGWLEG